MANHLTEFMRYTAPDAQALAQGIARKREQLALAVQAGAALATVDHAADLAALLTTDRREREALPLLSTHAAAADALPHEEASGWFWNAYATALQYAGQRDEADLCFAKTLQLARAGGWQRLQALALHHWGRSLVEQGRLADAQARITEALDIRTQLGDARGQASSQQALDMLAELVADVPSAAALQRDKHGGR